MPCRLSRAEAVLLACAAALLLLAWLGPPIAQPAGYHRFADQRAFWQLPMAMDVLSNLGFALAGVVGWLALLRRPSRALNNVERGMAALFFTGLLLTSAASAWYHLAPDGAGLMLDRCGMAIAFAGLLGLIAAGCISERAGAWLGLAVLLLGPFAARTALTAGNVLPWAVLQSGGMAMVLVLALRPRRRGSLPIRWSLVILAYTAAKVLEMNDQAIFELTAQWISGHTLKHAVAALAAVPVIFALSDSRESRQNAASATTTRQAPAPLVLHQNAQEETR